MIYILSTASMPRNEIDVEIKDFHDLESLKLHLNSLHINYADIDILLKDRSLCLGDETYHLFRR